MVKNSAAAEGPHWASLIDSLSPSVLVVLLQRDGTVTHANQAALGIVGATMRELIGTPIEQAPWLSRSPTAQQAFGRGLSAAKLGQPASFVLPVAHRGRMLTVEVALHPVFDDTGTLASFVLSGCRAGECEGAQPRASGQMFDGVSVSANGKVDQGRPLHTLERCMSTLPNRAAPDPRTAEIKDALRLAVQRDEFHLVYQPQVSVESGEIVGVEALLRWQHPRLGSISPDHFLPLAEESGLICQIGSWLLRRAWLVARKWQRQGLPAVRMTVNVSACQLQEPDFAAGIENLLAETGLDPRRIGIELAETVLTHNLDGAAAQLSRLRSLNIELALDGFGTGPSSLSSLRRLPLDVVKIDRSLVPGAGGDSDTLPIVRALIAMAHAFGMKVVAEGVANVGQLEILAASACDHFQGPHFSAPVSSEQVETMLRAGRKLQILERQPAPRSRNILVVDDDPLVARLLAQNLTWHFGETVKVTASVDPYEALHHMRNTPFDIIVSDLRMPEMDGIALLGIARDIQPNAVRMMLLGPTDLTRILEDQRQVDVFRYLSKPWTPEQFLAHCRAALNQVELACAQRTLARGRSQAAAAPGQAAVEMVHLERTDPGIATISCGPDDEMVLPAQLLTMPGDLWTMRDAPAAWA